MKYIQCKNVAVTTPLTIDSIENAEKKPKEIQRWISSVEDLHRSRAAPSVSYTKPMPDID